MMLRRSVMVVVLAVSGCGILGDAGRETELAAIAEGVAVAADAASVAVERLAELDRLGVQGEVIAGRLQDVLRVAHDASSSFAAIRATRTEESGADKPLTRQDWESWVGYLLAALGGGGALAGGQAISRRSRERLAAVVREAARAPPDAT